MNDCIYGENLDGDARQPAGAPDVDVPLAGGLPARPPRPGDVCPKCYTGRLGYNGLLNLYCPKCGHMPGSGGCFT